MPLNKYIREKNSISYIVWIKCTLFWMIKFSRAFRLAIKPNLMVVVKQLTENLKEFRYKLTIENEYAWLICD